MNTALLSKLLTFLSGCCATIATYGVVQMQAATEAAIAAAKAGLPSPPSHGMPAWLVVLGIVLTGGFAKTSIGALPVNQTVVAPKDGNGG